MKTYKLHLIRHGLTQGNIDKIYMGGGMDLPLCEEGRQELEDMALRYAYPNVGVLFSSPMKRALQSAEIIYPHVRERLVLEELRENKFGEFEGRKIDELMYDENFAKWLNPESDFVPSGGESGQSFALRTKAALFMMLEHMAKNGISEGACVTHGGVIMSMLSQSAMPQKPYSEWLSKNGTGFSVMADAAMIMRDGIVEVMGEIPFSC